MPKKDGRKSRIKRSLLSHPVRSCIIGCLLLLGFTYFWFAFGLPVVGFVAPTGKDIYKSDWLSFWGGFLSFAGATVLGAVAVWQNKQANQTNQKAIEENRRIYQIGFENELTRSKYLAIIHAIEEISDKVIEADKAFLSMLHDAQKTGAVNDAIRAYDNLLETMNFMVRFEFDRILPLSFDAQYPEIADYRMKIKEQLNQLVNSVEEQKRNVVTTLAYCSTNVHFGVTIGIDKTSLMEILDVFYDKLYNVDAYSAVTTITQEQENE